MMKTIIRALGVLALLCSVLFFTALTSIVVKKAWFAKSSSSGGKGHVEVVDLNGMILQSHTFLHALDTALEDDQTKAIVVRIDSPGGLVAPSQEIFAGIRRADEKKPVVIAMQSLAASGGYYAAVAGRKIFASPGTLTASVGVIMEFMNTEKLYKWAKLDRFTLKAGKFKDVGSPLRDMTAAEKGLLTSMLLDIHEEFRRTVKERRKLDDSADENYLDGRVMTGHQALEATLVDDLGGTYAAIKEAKAMGNLPEDAEVVYPEVNEGMLKRFLFGDEQEETLFDKFRILTKDALPLRMHGGWQILMLAPVN